MKPFSRSAARTYKTFGFVSLLLFVVLYFALYNGYTSRVAKINIVNKRGELVNVALAPFEKAYPFATNYERKDWHDWKFIEYEKSREGSGEQGKPFHLSDPKEIAENERLYQIEGLYPIASDKISVNRSVPDTRHPK